MEPTHASFFSGVGGLDLGLERAGWRTVSFSEIDPYASAVLAERFPGVPNLGDITGLVGHCECGPSRQEQPSRRRVRQPYCDATLWSGGFPCQDLSVAGKRRGMGTDGDRTRSGLAYAFLDLVERHRPSAILLENVPGLLSSNGGRDFGALLGRLGQLGYWWAYRILDAQFFGVPQRRRRVFVVALHAGAGVGADSPAAVLSVGARCDGHSAAGDEAGEGAAPGIASSIAASSGHHGHSSPRGDGSDNLVAFSETGKGWWTEGEHTSAFRAQGGGTPHHAVIERSSPDPGGVREADGLAGRLDDIQHFRKSRAAQTDNDAETWLPDDYANTINAWDQGDIRTKEIVLGGQPSDHALLPLGLDSHRYRCCGNGVVSNVSEWIGRQLLQVVEQVA